jgi:cytochrome c556
MKTLSRGLPAGLGLAALVWLAGTGPAGEDKEAVWKPVMPESAYKELLKRAAKAMQDDLDSKDKDDVSRGQVAAVRVAAYTLSVKGEAPNPHAGVRQAALRLAQMIKDGKDLGEAKRLAKSLPNVKEAAAAKVPDLTKYLADVGDLMNVYRPKKKGGAGLAEALQFSKPLKSQNGIEELLRYLAKKKLPAAALEKGSEELALLAYQMAADGALTATFAKDQAKGPALWRELALAQRDAAARLAEAAGKMDAAGVHKAATALDAACSQCHDKFRGK